MGSSIIENAISMSEAVEIRKLLFGDPKGAFLDAWKQGFYFD